MNVKYMDINDYNLIKDKKINYLALKYSLLMILIIGGLVIISIKMEYIKYLKTTGVVIDRDLVSINLLSSDISKFLNGELYIDDKRYDYQVFDISRKEQILSYVYQNITLNLNLDDKINYQNTELELKVVLEKKSLIKYLYSIMKGGSNG